ncbi:MAG: hypothetical protein EPO20_14855 [Betaproteobacteria bacterium]|nr:MAG: hypothetical protein EPO20_14855 [Betaproteobacteria bacterium]
MNGLTASIRNLIAGAGQTLNPLQEIQADQAAAETAQKLSLVEKARLEAEALRREQAAAEEAERIAPQRRTEFAAHSAGIDLPDATRLYKAISGARERPAIEYDDEGNLMPDVTFAKPESVAPGQERLFRSALAAAQANLLGTGKTNAEQLTGAAGNVQTQALVQAVQDAIAKGDLDTASAISQGATPGTQIKLHENIGTTGATFAPATGDVAADPAADPANMVLAGTVAELRAKAERERAAAALDSAKTQTERTKPPADFKDVTTLRKEWNDLPEVKAYKDVIALVESARNTPDTRAGDIQIAYAVGKTLDPNSVVREGELKLTGEAATLPEKIKGEMRSLVMGKGRMTPETRAQLVAMLDNAVTQREKTYRQAETTYRAIAEKNRIPVDQVITEPARRGAPKNNLPAGEVQARKKIGEVEFVKINGQWFQP